MIPSLPRPIAFLLLTAPLLVGGVVLAGGCAKERDTDAKIQGLLSIDESSSSTELNQVSTANAKLIKENQELNDKLQATKLKLAEAVERQQSLDDAVTAQKQELDKLRSLLVSESESLRNTVEKIASALEPVEKTATVPAPEKVTKAKTVPAGDLAGSADQEPVGKKANVAK